MVVVKMRGVLWYKIQREELEIGDHIYTLWGGDTKAHHGIYVNDKKVTHFNGEAWSDHSIYPTDRFHPLVLSSFIDCFLSGGDLYRFEYGVNPAHFLAKLGRGCTLASIISVFFAILTPFAWFYVKNIITIDWKGQIPRFLFSTKHLSGIDMKALIAFFHAFFYSNFVGAAAVGCGMYCVSRLVSDIGVHRDVSKVAVEKLVDRSGLVSVAANETVKEE